MVCDVERPVEPMDPIFDDEALLKHVISGECSFTSMSGSLKCMHFMRSVN